MKLLLMTGLLLGAAPASAQTVETALGDWAGVPMAAVRGEKRISSAAIDRMEKIAASGECSVPGLAVRRTDLTMPFLLKFNEGAVERVVIKRLNCKPLESLMGAVVLQMTLSGDFKATGENELGWYRGEVSISWQ